MSPCCEHSAKPERRAIGIAHSSADTRRAHRPRLLGDAELTGIGVRRERVLPLRMHRGRHTTLSRLVTRHAMSAASTNAVAPSYIDAFETSIPVSAQIIDWYS